MPKTKQDNDRRFRRQGLRILVDYHGEDGLRCDYATSISAGGLFVETECPLPLESHVKLRFRLPEGESLHEIEGRVCWRNDRGGDGAPGFGVAFIGGKGTESLGRELEDIDF